MSVAVIVPWRPGCPERGRAWGWVNRWWATYHPVLPVHTALAPAGAWCKARAAMPAVQAATADIVILADADVVCAGVDDAIAAVKAGAPWAIPHRLVKRLTSAATDRLLDGAAPGRLPLTQRAYQGVEGGGMLVIPRSTLLDIPLDPRFTDWGQEDVSHALALRTLAGAPWRGDADLFHLHHPAAQRMSRVYGSLDGRALYRQYLRARRDPDAMRWLIDEGKRHDPRSAPQPAVHDHAA